MNTTEFLSKLSSESGDSIQLNEEGHCLFMYEKTLPIYLESSPDRETACIYTPFSKLPTSKDKLRYYTYLMRVHLLGELTQNSYFGINPQKTNIYLFKNISLREKNYNEALLEIYNFSVAYRFFKEQATLEH